MADKILQNKVSKLQANLKDKLTELEKKGVIAIHLNTGVNDPDNLAAILVRSIEMVSEVILETKY